MTSTWIKQARIREVFYLVCIGLTICFAGNGFAANQTVTTTNDSGAGSLGQAMADVGAGETISFSITGTITLSSSLPTITKNMTINGPGAGSLTINDAPAKSLVYKTRKFSKEVMFSLEKTDWVVYT